MTDKLDLYRAAAAGIAAKENPTTAELFIPGMMEMIEKLSAPAITFNHISHPILTIYNDGRIVLADHAQPTEAAADRIEALEAENARFRKALEFYADDYPFGNEARKALGVR